MSERELRRLYSQHRIEVSEHVESCLRQLADHLPGFQYETIVDQRGWGGAVGRSDLQIREGSAGNAFSRLEMVVRPLSSVGVLELASKGTVRNREALQPQPLPTARRGRRHHLLRDGRPLGAGIRRSLFGRKLALTRRLPRCVGSGCGRRCSRRPTGRRRARRSRPAGPRPWRNRRGGRRRR